MVKNENQSVFENFFAIEIGGLLFAFSIKTGIFVTKT